MALYKNVLHHNANQLEKHQLEALGIYVSLFNHCDYCVAHHYQGYKRLIDDEKRSLRARQALQTEQFESVFSTAEICLFEYAKKLTLNPQSVQESDR